MAQPGNILILAELEDEQRLQLESASQGAGFAATVEPSAEVAISKLGTKRYDALVVHMSTPGAALACMRARGKLLRVRMPVIALADVEDDAHFARAYRASADEVLVVDRPKDLAYRLASMPKPSIPQPGNARGDAVVADADRTRAEVIERVLRDAGFRVEMAMDGFAARLQAGRPSLKVAVVDASLDDVPTLIAQARAKASRCAWVVRARPEQLDELKQKLSGVDRVAVVSAYGPPEDVLFETNRMIEPRSTDGRGDARQLYGTIVRLHFGGGDEFQIGYTYNVSPLGLFVRTLLAPPTETLRLSVVPPGGTERVSLEGRVVWRREFGATKREPVPAGFGVQITGGDTAAWAEACPRVPSLRPPAMGSERARARDVTPDPPSVAPAPAAASTAEPPKVMVPRPSPSGTMPRVAVDATATPIVRPDIQIAQVAASVEDAEAPRGAQSSVEEMLAQVLEQTLGDEIPGSAAPLSMDDSVVSIKDPEPRNDAVTTRVDTSAAASLLRDEVIGFGVTSPPSTRGETPLHDITAEALGFAAEEEPPPRPPSVRPEPMGEPLPLATVKSEPPPPASEATTEVANDVPPLVEAEKLIAASTGETAKKADEPWALVTSPTLDYEAALATAAPDPLPGSEPPRPMHDGTLRSWPPAGPRSERSASEAPASAGGTGNFTATGGPDPATTPSSEPPSSPVPGTSTRSRMVAFAILAVLGGAIAAIVLVPQRGPEPAPAPERVAAQPTAAQPTAATPATAAPTTEAPAPSTPAEPVASAEPPVPSAEPPAPPVIATASTVKETPPASTAPVAPAANAGAGEPDAAALATLPRGQGFLWVDSPLATNVYVYGNLAGTTRQRITTKCGPRFLRLGTAPGVWQSEGVVVVVKCGGFSRVEIAP